MEVVVRRAEERDVPALARLYVEFHNFHAVGVPARLRVVEREDDELCEAIRRIVSNEKAALLVACLGDEAVGFLETYLRETEPNPAVVPRTYAHLQSLAVTARLRKRGIGARLMQAAQDWCRANGATEIELETWEFPEGPLGFYESLGYETVKRRLVAKI